MNSETVILLNRSTKNWLAPGLILTRPTDNIKVNWKQWNRKGRVWDRIKTSATVRFHRASA